LIEGGGSEWREDFFTKVKEDLGMEEDISTD